MASMPNSSKTDEYESLITFYPTMKKSKHTGKRIVPVTTKSDQVVLTSMVKSRSIAEIVMLTSYPPRECGIATYSSDLKNTLEVKFGKSFKLTILPLVVRNDIEDYTDNNENVLNTEVKSDFIKAAKSINDNPNVGLVVIQHEFGLFKNNEEAFYHFLKSLEKPIVFTFHTVLPKPDSNLRAGVSFLAAKAHTIIVMTKNSAKILSEEYGVSADIISVIPHGTHLVSYGNRLGLKKKYNLKGKNVLSTFGLLGPGKNIETTLYALPEILRKIPNTTFLIIGKSHPNVIKEQGETYRNNLQEIIHELGIEDHVRFVNKFVPLNELLEYLQLTDIYLFTSNDPNQAVSGTFSYALSCGCPVVSTPIPHAKEVLQNGAGAIFDFENFKQLATIVSELLRDRRTKSEMRLKGLNFAAESAWENSAIAYAKIFKNACHHEILLEYVKPKIKLHHLKKMTTDVGIIQFSKVNEPDILSGYTLDDNARALIALCQHYELTGDYKDLHYLRTYFNFIKNCFRHDAHFLNYVDDACQFTEQNEEVNLEDANGRAIWALGFLVSKSTILPQGFSEIIDNAEHIFLESLQASKEYTSPRALGFILKGIYYFNLNRTNKNVIEFAENLGDRLVAQFENEQDGQWKWFEGYFTYGNAVLPQALLMAFELIKIEQYKTVAKISFDFLLSKIFDGSSIRVVTNINWLTKGDIPTKEFEGGEQPIDVAYTILALKKFHEHFPDAGYDLKMEGAFNWFMGDNELHQTIYNPCTGGCYDGLEKFNVNINQGAESSISYLLARMAFEEVESTETYPQNLEGTHKKI